MAPSLRRAAESLAAGCRTCAAGRSASVLLIVVALWLLTGTTALALTPGQREQARRSLEAADRGQWLWSLRLARNLGDQDLLDYLDWLELRDPSVRANFDTYRTFIWRHPGWPALTQLRLGAEQALNGSESDQEVLDFFADAAPLTVAGKMRWAQALVATGREADAVAVIRASWIEDSPSAAQELDLLDRYGQQLGAADHIARLDRLLWDGDIPAARRMLPRVDAGWRALAKARMALRQSAPTMDRDVAAVPPALARDPGLAYERVRWRHSKGRDAEARDLLLHQSRDEGRPDLWWEERSDQLRQSLADRDYRTAYRLAARHGLADGTAFLDAEWTAGWLALRFLDDPAMGLRHFARMADAARMPVSRARAAYWSARAARALGQVDRARHWYAEAAAFGTTYYGQLAAEENAFVLQADAVIEASAPAPLDLGRRAPARILRLLCQIGDHDRALPFLTKLAADAADTTRSGSVLELAASCGRDDLVVRAAKAVTGTTVPDLRASHPLPKVRAFTEASPGSPEPALRLALARQESLFEVDARSRAGARGLMQLMPATARAMARELGLPFAAERLTRDPNYNVRLGTHYLERQLATFDGHLPLALAAYNAGPSRAAQWIDSFGDPRRLERFDLIDWIELIPFSETRNYVQRVLENRVVYGLILGNPGARRIVPVPAGQRDAQERDPDPDRS